MAYSGTIGLTSFNALKVIEHAFRRCRIPAQGITAEMQAYALESLYTTLSELSNINTPSWCIEQKILPLYENQPIVTLPVGTIDVLNLNYRVIQTVTGTNTMSSTTYQVYFSSATPVSTVGIKWSGTSVPVTFQVSDDGATWTDVGSSTVTAIANEITWADIEAPKSYRYFRIHSVSSLLLTSVTLGNTPQEIPLGQLNRDSYVNQNNKIFPSRPCSYYFQRDLARPVVNLWPAPFAAAETAQLILWRHRQIMDTSNLQQDIEIPTRWLEAIISTLSAKVAAETPQVDASLLPLLEQKSIVGLQRAWDGDSDGSPTFINPNIGVYTR